MKFYSVWENSYNKLTLSKKTGGFEAKREDRNGKFPVKTVGLTGWNLCKGPALLAEEKLLPEKTPNRYK